MCHVQSQIVVQTFDITYKLLTFHAYLNFPHQTEIVRYISRSDGKAMMRLRNHANTAHSTLAQWEDVIFNRIRQCCKNCLFVYLDVYLCFHFWRLRIPCQMLQCFTSSKIVYYYEFAVEFRGRLQTYYPSHIVIRFMFNRQIAVITACKNLIMLSRNQHVSQFNSNL